jgi:hypothetical protein
MVRAFFVALTLALGVQAEPGPGPAPREPTPTPVPRSVLAVFFHEVGPGSELARVDPLTLKAERVIRLTNGGGWATAFSPDRKTLAISGGMGMATVELIDLRRMRSRGVVDLDMTGGVNFLFWERGRGLFAVVDDYDRRAVVRIDPVSGTVQARHAVDGTILQVKRGVNGQVVLLLGPRRGIGPLRLAVVGGKGMAETTVPRLTGGTSTERDGDDIRVDEVIPALVVDRDGRRALVYAKGTVAEISLADLSATTHTLSEPVSTLQRFRNWLEPNAHAKIVDGYYRSGEWIGNGRFAVTGMDFAEGESTAAGLSIVDTRSWTLRNVADGATELGVSGGDTLLTFGYHANEGVRGFDLSGRELFHLLRGRSAWIQLVGNLVYAQIEDGRRIAVIDPRAGRKIAEAAVDRPVMLVDDPPTPLE